MTSTLHAFASGGHLVISFPEASVPPQEREDFIAFLKAEWTARQSRFTETDAKALADEVDAGWWTQNREHILRSIGARMKKPSFPVCVAGYSRWTPFPRRVISHP